MPAFVLRRPAWILSEGVYRPSDWCNVQGGVSGSFISAGCSLDLNRQICLTKENLRYRVKTSGPLAASEAYHLISEAKGAKLQSSSKLELPCIVSPFQGPSFPVAAEAEIL
jgi:hypothetical protein